MDSLGKILREAREERNLSTRQVAQDTNIPRYYIEAMEAERFETFPAEVYVVGFLHNYAEYLKLESEEIIALYKNHKIREEPTPIEELLGKKRPASGKRRLLLVGVLLSLLAAAVCGGLFLFIGPWALSEKKAPPLFISEKSAPPRELDLSQTPSDLRLTDGDRLRIREVGESLYFQFQKVGTTARLWLVTPQGKGTSRDLILGEEAVMPLPEGSALQAVFLLKEVGPGEKGVLLRASLIPVKPPLADTETSPSSQQTLEKKKASSPPPPPPQDTPQERSKTDVFLTSRRPRAYQVVLTFRGDCFFRYEYNGVGRQERYYTGGETLRLNVRGTLQLGTSNGGKAVMEIEGKKIVLGKEGEVVVKQLLWKKGSSGLYELIIQST